MAKGGNNRGFTLIELLIVVVVIATMMGILFRLAGVGGDSQARNNTITRIQKLEYALSGYYAAFGSYPPVPLHGSRDIFQDVNSHGVQMGSGKGSTSTELDWRRVRAACLSQPVAVEFPFNDNDNDERNAVAAIAETFRQKAQRDSSYNKPIFTAGFSAKIDASTSDLKKYQKWGDIQLFKFGVLSFLMPRYLFMLGGDKKLYDDGSAARTSGQWASQNSLARLYNLKTGRPLYYGSNAKWENVQRDTQQGQNRAADSNDRDSESYRQIANQPSQAVCARWMQALDGIVSGGRTFYGVNTLLNHDEDTGAYHLGSEGVSIYSAGNIGDPQTDSNSQQYLLDGMTIRDGWGRDLYYYSPPPYQGYRVWSGGKDGMTVPPWIDISTLQSKQRKTAAAWLADDIVNLSASAD